MRNLMTTYVNPQCHADFDDLFQTVFSSGENDMIIDAIWNRFFENNCGLYAEDEFNVERELIFFFFLFWWGFMLWAKALG